VTRLIVLVEGQTEEAFVKALLRPHLEERGVYVSATIVGKLIGQGRGHGQRGGGHYRHWRRDLVRLLQPRTPDLRVTTLFDLYGLPEDFPEYDSIMQSRDRSTRRAAFERALAEDVKDHRLLPYIQQYEFEALVLAALPSLRQLLDAPDQLTGLAALEAEIVSMAPEDVNDGPDTAPSKRLLNHIPGYRKVLFGELATVDTGLSALRTACPGFNGWIDHLERLGAVADDDQR